MTYGNVKHTIYKNYQFFSFTRSGERYFREYKLTLLVEGGKLFEIKFNDSNVPQELYNFSRAKIDRVMLAYGSQDIDFLRYRDTGGTTLIWSPSAASYYHFPLDEHKLSWLVYNIPYEDWEIDK